MSTYSLAIRWRPETLRSLAFGGISGTFAAVGAVLANPISSYKISNDTDANLIISYDGVNDHEFVASNSFVLFDAGANKSNRGQGLFLSQGDRLFVRQEVGAPTSGNVYFSVYFASTN